VDDELAGHLPTGQEAALGGTDLLLQLPGLEPVPDQELRDEAEPDSSSARRQNAKAHPNAFVRSLRYSSMTFMHTGFSARSFSMADSAFFLNPSRQASWAVSAAWWAVKAL
jgi:hypothetical protein